MARLGVWSTGAPTVKVDAQGTLRATIPLKDAGVLAVTLDFTMTAEHGLRVDVTSASGPNGLTAFEAWSNT